MAAWREVEGAGCRGIGSNSPSFSIGCAFRRLEDAMATYEERRSNKEIVSTYMRRIYGSNIFLFLSWKHRLSSPRIKSITHNMIIRGVFLPVSGETDSDGHDWGIRRKLLSGTIWADCRIGLLKFPQMGSQNNKWCGLKYKRWT